MYCYCSNFATFPNSYLNFSNLNFILASITLKITFESSYNLLLLSYATCLNCLFPEMVINSLILKNSELDASGSCL
jgi:hypothetical protein